MVKQLKKGGNRLKTAYWSLVGMASVEIGRASCRERV